MSWHQHLPPEDSPIWNIVVLVLVAGYQLVRAEKFNQNEIELLVWLAAILYGKRAFK